MWHFRKRIGLWGKWIWWGVNRLHLIGQFIVDFYAHSLMLVIELDGSVHNSNEAKEYDENRTAFLNELGIKVIRFTNQQVEQYLMQVVKEIETVINEIQSSSIN